MVYIGHNKKTKKEIKKMEFDTYFEMKFKVKVSRYIPDRAAPCYKLRSGAFFDDGDKEEMEYNVFFDFESSDGELIPVPQEIIDNFRKEIEADIRDELRNQN